MQHFSCKNSVRVAVHLVFAQLLSSIILCHFSSIAFAQDSTPLPPQAPRERILIMLVRGQDIGISEQAIRTRVQELVEKNLHAEIVSNEEAFVQVGSSFQKMLEDCRGAAPCYARLVGSVDARYLLVLSAKKARDLLLFGSRLIDLDVQEVLGKAIGRLSGEDSLMEAIEAQLKKTVPEAMWSPYGSLHVKVEPAGAQVLVNKKLLGISPLPVIKNILPGSLTVETRLAGYQDVLQTVEISRTEKTETNIVLKPTEGILSKWWFWTSLGVVAASGIVGAVIVSGQGSPVFCSSPDPNLCP